MGTIIQPQMQEAITKNSAHGPTFVMIPEAIQKVATKLEPLLGKKLRSERDESERLGTMARVEYQQLIGAFAMRLLLRAFAAGELEVFSNTSGLLVPRDFWNLAILATFPPGELHLLGQRGGTLPDWAQRMGSPSFTDGYPLIRQDELDRWIERQHRDRSAKKTSLLVQQIAGELMEIHQRNKGALTKAQAKRQLSENVGDHTFRAASRVAAEKLGIAKLFQKGRPAKSKSVD